jgi:hypothetical protein
MENFEYLMKKIDETHRVEERYAADGSNCE